MESVAAGRTDQLWRSDIPDLATGEGWLYRAAVPDGYSRRRLGWATDERLAGAALEGARRERGEVRGVIVHTDRGSQDASADDRHALATLGAIASMSPPSQLP